MLKSIPVTLTLLALVALMAVTEQRGRAQSGSVPPSYAPPNEGLPNPYAPAIPFGQLPNDRQLPFFTGIQVDTKNTIWAFARGAGETLDAVLQFDTTGKLLRSWGKGLFYNPHSLDLDKDGNIWLADSGFSKDRTKGNQIYKFSPDGKLLLALGKPGHEGKGPEEFYQPNAVKIAPNGDVFVASEHSFPECPDSRIQKFTKDGKFIKQFGLKGEGEAATTCPHQLAFDSQGKLYAAELGKNFRISVWDQDGKFLYAWKQFGSVTGVYIDLNDMIYGTDSISTDDMNMNKNSPGHGYNPGVKRGIRIGSVKDGKVIAFIPDPNPMSLAPTVHGRETLAVDHQGNIYQTPDSSPNCCLTHYFKKYIKKQ